MDGMIQHLLSRKHLPSITMHPQSNLISMQFILYRNTSALSSTLDEKGTIQQSAPSPNLPPTHQQDVEESLVTYPDSLGLETSFPYPHFFSRNLQLVALSLLQSPSTLKPRNQTTFH